MNILLVTKKIHSLFKGWGEKIILTGIICYSPQSIAQKAGEYFQMVENKQSYDERENCVVDTQP